jgi:hypothetical protein
VKRPARAHILALIAALAAIIATSALWVVNLRLGPPLDGWVAGPMVVFVPAIVLILSAIWLLVRAVLHGRVRWRSSSVLAATLGLSLVVVLFTCGPIACFTPGNNRLLGWFVAGGVAIAGLVHHLVLNRLTPVPPNGR